MRGAGSGAQAARSSLEPPGSHPGGKPPGNPGVHLPAADSRWAQRGVGVGRAGAPPLPGLVSCSGPCGLAGDRERCRPAGLLRTGLRASSCGLWRNPLRTGISRRCYQHSLLGWECERSALGVAFRGTLGAATSPSPTAEAPLRGDLFLSVV